MNKQIANLIMAQKYINIKIKKFLNPEIFNIITNEITELNSKINKIYDILRDLVAFHPEVQKIITTN
jgi:hypothetical protein